MLARARIRARVSSNLALAPARGRCVGSVPAAPHLNMVETLTGRGARVWVAVARESIVDGESDP